MRARAARSGGREGITHALSQWLRDGAGATPPSVWAHRSRLAEQVQPCPHTQSARARARLPPSAHVGLGGLTTVASEYAFAAGRCATHCAAKMPGPLASTLRKGSTHECLENASFSRDTRPFFAGAATRLAPRATVVRRSEGRGVRTAHGTRTTSAAARGSCVLCMKPRRVHAAGTAANMSAARHNRTTA